MTEGRHFQQTPGDGWWFRRWASGVMAGVTGRATDPAALLRHLQFKVSVVEAEQVHGSSVAVVGRSTQATRSIAGCDALLTGVPGVALLVRTADCLPLFIADPGRGVVGIAHAGWRGLAACLPLRVIAAFSRYFHSRPDELYVAIGPAIRVCCYEVGAEFRARFQSFVQRRRNRWVCDLIGVARQQFGQGGVRPRHVVDCRRCTACETPDWCSLRREGPSTGRLTSLIALRP